MDIYEEFLVAFFFVIITSLVIFGFRKLLENRKRKSVNDASLAKSGHYWTPIHFIDRGFFCAFCKNHLTTGYECDYCSLKVDEVSCMRQIAFKILCKTNHQIDDGPLKHHWIPGNIDSDRFCCVCDELCGGGVGLQDFRCSWCIRVVHTRCQSKVSEICDLGELRDTLILPRSVITRKAGNRNQRMPVIESLTPPTDINGWRPIIIIVNPKSGSGTGKSILKAFRSYLHPVQVIDVTKSNIRASLNWIEEHQEIDVRILIAGGDGTISLVLDDIDKLERRPPVAILPLGTGNDLSRVLGWGKENNGNLGLIEILKDVQNSIPQNLDRWKVNIENYRKLGIRFSSRFLSMTNYVSIGVDACVTFGMQTTRDSMPRALSSRLLNKFLFLTYGTKDVFERACKGLNNNIELILDDKKIDLPNIEGLVFLNIGSWGAGVKPWEGAEDLFPQSLDDGKFEVFAVTSSFHIAQLQVGFSSPLFIGQGSKALLRVNRGPIPMQRFLILTGVYIWPKVLIYNVYIIKKLFLVMGKHGYKIQQQLQYPIKALVLCLCGKADQLKEAEFSSNYEDNLSYAKFIIVYFSMSWLT